MASLRSCVNLRTYFLFIHQQTSIPPSPQYTLALSSVKPQSTGLLNRKQPTEPMLYN